MDVHQSCALLIHIKSHLITIVLQIFRQVAISFLKESIDMDLKILIHMNQEKQTEDNGNQVAVIISVVIVVLFILYAIFFF